MHQMTLDEYMAWPWKHHVKEESGGGYRLTVTYLTDFEIFAETAEELESDWRDALRSHLQAYLKIGKVIPVPFVRVAPTPDVETSTGSPAQETYVDENLRIREPQAA